MAKRRTPVLLACAAGIAAGLFGLWRLVGEGGGDARPTSNPVHAPEAPREVAAPSSAEPRPESGEIRDEAAIVPAGPWNGAVDDFLPEGFLAPRLPPRVTTAVAGRLLDSAGAPVPEARVLVSWKATYPGAALDSRANAGRVREATSDASGRFRILDVDAGSARLAVRHGRFAPFELPSLSLPAGEVTDLGDLTLAGGVVLAGRVVDPERRPLPGATLERVRTPLAGPVQRLGGEAATPLGATDENGRFQLPALEPGRVALVVRATGLREGVFDLDAAAGDPALADLELVLERGASITGRVREFDPATMRELDVVAIPADGPQLFSEDPPGGANSGWLAGVAWTQVDPYGNFELAGLDPGRAYLVRACLARAGSRANEFRRDPAHEDPWSPFVRAPAGARDLALAYLPGAVLAFEARDRVTGAPVERLALALEGASSADLPRPDASGPWMGAPEGGRFRAVWPGGRVVLADLRPMPQESDEGGADMGAEAPGAERETSVTLHVRAPGYDDVEFAGLRLEPGARLDLGPVVMSPVPLFRARIVDARTGEPVSGARVELLREGGPMRIGRARSEGLSDARGLVALSTVNSSTAALRAEREGFAPARALVPMLAAPDAAPFELRLEREARVQVVVRDTRGAPAPCVEVLLTRHAMADGLVWWRSSLTDAAGTAWLSEVPPGVFDLACSPRLGFAALRGAAFEPSVPRRIELAPGEEARFELEVPALASLRGTIWRGREPLAGARLAFDRAGSDFAGLGTDQTEFTRMDRCGTDAAGEFGPVELAPGDYALLIEQPELDLRTLRVVRVAPGDNEVILDVDDTAITGRVTRADGSPAEDVDVRAFVDRRGPRMDIRPALDEFLLPRIDYRSPVATARTDSDGRYRLGAVPPGMRLELSFSQGNLSVARPKINAPLGRTLENVNATLPSAGSLEIVLSAPLAPQGLHHAVRIVGIDQPEGFTLFARDFDGDGRARFEELSPGRWAVLVASVDDAGLIAELREPQLISVKPGKLTEFRAGW